MQEIAAPPPEACPAHSNNNDDTTDAILNIQDNTRCAIHDKIKCEKR
jgi:hypothetical protein